MKKVLNTIAIITSLLAFQLEANSQSSTARSRKVEAKTATEKAAIEKLIFAYQDALNASDAAKVTALYTKDGVLMANAAPTAEGADQVKRTYQYVFDNFNYDLQFNILNIEVSGNTAYARSTSKGSFVIKESGQKVADENRELFVLEKVNGQWKIARYMYNKTK